jgi:predicted ester cyclase
MKQGAKAVAETFWAPLLTSLTSLQRREDIFFAGLNEIDGFTGVWVVSMGHLMGLFDAPWLGIRPTRKLVMLRYAEFHHVRDGRIVETAQFVDIPHLMTQAGQNPFGPATAQHLVQPGPRTMTACCAEFQPPEDGAATLAVINAMIGDLGTWNLGLPLEEELRRTWHEDMLWWGPEGIGATYTIPRYAAQHSGPFRAAFTDRTRTGHLARLAEGHYGGFFGWPNFTARHTGGFMGLPGTTRPAEFRVVDIYRREGDKLAENWIFIDMLHFFRSQGVDLLERMNRINGA